MKYTYYSPLFSMFAKIAGAGKQKNNIIMTVTSRVGIKFDIISVEKIYPGQSRIKKYLWFETEGNKEPPV